MNLVSILAFGGIGWTVSLAASIAKSTLEIEKKPSLANSEIDKGETINYELEDYHDFALDKSGGEPSNMPEKKYLINRLNIQDVPPTTYFGIYDTASKNNIRGDRKFIHNYAWQDLHPVDDHPFFFHERQRQRANAAKKGIPYTVNGKLESTEDLHEDIVKNQAMEHIAINKGAVYLPDSHRILYHPDTPLFFVKKESENLHTMARLVYNRETDKFDRFEPPNPLNEIMIEKKKKGNRLKSFLEKLRNRS